MSDSTTRAALCYPPRDVFPFSLFSKLPACAMTRASVRHLMFLLHLLMLLLKPFVPCLFPTLVYISFSCVPFPYAFVYCTAFNAAFFF